MNIPDRYWTGKPLWEKGLPWLTPGAIRALDAFVRPEFDVLEFGAGGSTLFFGRRCRSVVSWEPDASWRKKVKALSGSNVIITGQMESTRKGAFDVVLVDSHGATTNREAISRIAMKQVKSGGWFILDNYARYDIRFLDGWRKHLHDDPHWSGKGTLIATPA